MQAYLVTGERKCSKACSNALNCTRWLGQPVISKTALKPSFIRLGAPPPILTLQFLLLQPLWPSCPHLQP